MTSSPAPQSSVPPAVVPADGTPQPAARKRSCLPRSCLLIFVVVVVLACGLTGVDYMLDQNNYQKAHAAYLEGDCDTAITSYNDVINGIDLPDFGDFVQLSKDERAECEDYRSYGDLKQDQPGNAMIKYQAFIDTYPQSALAEPSRKHMLDLFTTTAPAALAGEDLCNNVDALAETAGVKTSEAFFPDLVNSCAQSFEDAGDLDGAITFYGRFLSDYPDHALFSEVEDAYARTMIQNARSQGAGEIPVPMQVAGASSDTTMVVIQNDSPNSLRIIFSGEEDTRIETLDACADCQKYFGDGPEYCPEQGPVGSYELASGSYEVMVESSDGGDVTPFTGTWPLEGGEYYTCFFIVTSTQ